MKYFWYILIYIDIYFLLENTHEFKLEKKSKTVNIYLYPILEESCVSLSIKSIYLISYIDLLLKLKQSLRFGMELGVKQPTGTPRSPDLHNWILVIGLVSYLRYLLGGRVPTPL